VEHKQDKEITVWGKCWEVCKRSVVATGPSLYWDPSQAESCSRHTKQTWDPCSEAYLPYEKHRDWVTERSKRGAREL